MLTVVCLLVVTVLAICYRPLLFATVDPEVAAARGVPVRALGIVFAALMGVVAAQAVQIVGALLVMSLLITPAAAAARVVVAPVAAIATSVGRGGGRLDSPGGQHGDHHGVGAAEPFQQPRLGGAQRRAVERQRASAGVFDRPAQRLDVAGVAGQVLGTVVEHRDRRAGLAGVRTLQHPQVGVATGGVNPKPVISTVSHRKACNSRRLSTPPWAR